MIDVLAEINGNINTIGYGIAAIGPGIGVALVFAAYMQSVARQPEAAPLLQTYVFLGLAFIEILALLGFVLAFAAPGA